MKGFENEIIVSPTLKFIICDLCQKEYKVSDIHEIQEFTHLHKVCGYESIFGDGCKIELDICQHCLDKIINVMENFDEEV